MILTQAKASADEIDRLRKLVGKVDNVQKLPPTKPKPDKPKRKPGPPKPPTPENPIFNGALYHQPITAEPLKIPNAVELLLLLMPEVKPYPWQFEALMHMSGYLDPGKYYHEDHTNITDETPFKGLYPTCNGGGKDMVIIAAFAVWFALVGKRNRVIITSGSHDQIKFQTEPHIRELIIRANRKFGTLFKSVQFHHVVPDLGGEIKLFATDEPKRAEGYHPFPGGKMALIANEAKSLADPMFEAMNRCTGYSHFILISSPGRKSGYMFNQVADAVHHPAPPQLGKFYYRKVTSYDCPHLPKSHIEALKLEYGEGSPFFKSSILAEFSDFDEPIVVTDSEYQTALDTPIAAQDNDIGIGLDLAAGGDENACFIRRGNKIIHSFFFTQQDTDLAALLIDKNLMAWKTADYVLRADDGGVGKGINDKLTILGWRIVRTNNQSPARNKREFLNLGAEMWFHVKRLIQRKVIILPNAVSKFRRQLTSRHFRGFDSTQGRFALESKKEAKSAGRPSPDRADAYVLCLYSYRPPRQRLVKKDTRHLIPLSKLNEYVALNRGLHAKRLPAPGRFTTLNTNI